MESALLAPLPRKPCHCMKWQNRASVTPGIPHSRSLKMVLYGVYLLWLCCSFQLVQAGEKQKWAREVFMHTMDDETYETLLLLVQGKFNVPAVVRFGRKRDLFALGPEESPTLYFNGKKAVKTSDVSRIVGKTFKETKSERYKKLKQRTADGYAGLTERQIRHVTSNNIKYRIYNAVFKNKVLPKPVRAKHVHSQHQIDLIDLTKQLNSSSLLVRLSAMSSLRWTCLVVI